MLLITINQMKLPKLVWWLTSTVRREGDFLYCRDEGERELLMGDVLICSWSRMTGVEAERKANKAVMPSRDLFICTRLLMWPADHTKSAPHTSVLSLLLFAGEVCLHTAKMSTDKAEM